MPDVSLFLGIGFLQHPDVCHVKVRTIPIPECKCITLPLSEIPEGMPSGIMVATDHISLRVVFNLEHHSAKVLDSVMLYFISMPLSRVQKKNPSSRQSVGSSFPAMRL